MSVATLSDSSPGILIKMGLGFTIEFYLHMTTFSLLFSSRGVTKSVKIGSFEAKIVNFLSILCSNEA